MTSDIQAIEQGRERFLDLLLLADPSVELVQQYLAEGHLFVLYEKGEACGVVHLLPQTATIMEVKNIAVKEEAQGCGYGKRLLQYALDFCHRQGYEKVRVGTGNSSINNLCHLSGLLTCLSSKLPRCQVRLRRFSLPHTLA